MTETKDTDEWGEAWALIYTLGLPTALLMLYRTFFTDRGGQSLVEAIGTLSLEGTIWLGLVILGTQIYRILLTPLVVGIIPVNSEEQARGFVTGVILYLVGIFMLSDIEWQLFVLTLSFTIAFLVQIRNESGISKILPITYAVFFGIITLAVPIVTLL
ncbi:hypothetical protein AUR64_18405 [Haloprofundus marisrubri]|uniref:Uncharacterized protein n=1 Tax=Haloprofundus marisrubri TaxID=1514971 RepID=A0A0W1R5F2_9EURY|nr:hypothetical protein [Haloprofundus marisrubri]KTG08638.1 hypothetical protein AUR64_18405 [Haloprofundus marisrubri]